MATVKLIDPPAPQRPKMDRPCQITLEPHEAWAVCAVMGNIAGSLDGPRGTMQSIWEQIKREYAIETAQDTVIKHGSMYLADKWPTIPGIVDAPKVTP